MCLKLFFRPSSMCCMPHAKKDNVEILSSNKFPVVGIGASAGGLDAFKRLVKAIPLKSGMAYILVQHLDPAHDSILTEILQRETKIPIREIIDNIHVEVNHIYIIPSNKLLTATDGVLQLSARLPKGEKNMPIDLFFSSLAEVHQNHAIGVVLSGTGNDGTLGLKSIKEESGITFAQDPRSATYDGMPQSAINAGVVDFVLNPEDLPGQLLALSKSLNIHPLIEEGKALQPDDDKYNQILAILQFRKEVDFTYYKQTTIRRRIDRRIALSMKGNIASYVKHLKANESEQDTLFQDLLIPVTEFFRDKMAFNQLCTMIFPSLLKGRTGNEPLRVWVAGCSTGEEAYSIVICLKEYLGIKDIAIDVQVFATDISEIAIAKARAGVYKKSDVTGLSPERLKQFFTKVDGNYRLHKSVRDSCIFAHHNFLKDAPFARMDLISCRNALIYLQPTLQKNVLTTFHYALKENGFLLLGNSETAAQASELFNTYDKVNKIYTRKAVKGKFAHVISQRKTNFQKPNVSNSEKQEPSRDDFQKSADEVLLSRFAPSGVVVNNDLDIVQFRGATGIWLEPSPGKPNLNVLKMTRQDLSFELRNALLKAQKSKVGVIKEGIPIQILAKDHLVSLEVIPLPHTVTPHFLVLFTDTTAVTAIADGLNNDLTSAIAIQSKENKRNQKLQLQLAQTREDMRSITEDQEAFNEELQSANEELLSGSEELQSLNEELETSKEEIQTSNEELITVNQELNDRNEQLNLSRLYSESIVTTIREPLIILNKNLQVISANRSYYNKFQTTEEETVGKLLFELGNKQWNIPRLRKMLDKMLPDKTSIVDFEIVKKFSDSRERILLINATQIFKENAQEQSILIAIEDITEKRKTDKALQSFSEELEKQILDRTYSLHEAITELQHSNKNLEQFAYIASHDLQEPLRKIRTFSHLLQTRYQKDLPEDANVLVTKIESSSERMSTLIKGVLNFSKILHGDMVFEKTNLNVILGNVVDDFELLIAEKGAVIQQNLLPTINAIPLQMNQLFTNLMSNSLKFLKKELHPVISISSANLTRAQVKTHKKLNQKLAYCCISFKDNGIGFDQEYADNIFLLFQRLHAHDQFAGTGIGLALCKSIVISHHGEINAVSSRDKGAAFNIILPI
jgi:two-component system CheB/CheR fusion protein